MMASSILSRIKSPFGLGTAVFGSQVARAQSFELMETYVELGGNFFDTAHIYAAWLPKGHGQSERTLGEWLAVHQGREELVISTKGAHPPMDQLDAWRCSKDDIEQDLAESLERLRLTYIDLYWLHRDEPAREVGEIVEAMDALVKGGAIKSWGISNWTPERIDAAIQYAESHELARPIAAQQGASLADWPKPEPPVPGLIFMDSALREWHAQNQLPLVAYTSQAAGFFGEANVTWMKNGAEGDAPLAPQYDSPLNRQRLLRTITLAETKACTPNQIALAWLLALPFPVYPLLGTSRIERLREAMESLRIELDREEMEYLIG